MGSESPPLVRSMCWVSYHSDHMVSHNSTLWCTNMFLPRKCFSKNTYRAITEGAAVLSAHLDQTFHITFVKIIMVRYDCSAIKGSRWQPGFVSGITTRRTNKSFPNNVTQLKPECYGQKGNDDWIGLWECFENMVVALMLGWPRVSVWKTSISEIPLSK